MNAARKDGAWWILPGGFVPTGPVMVLEAVPKGVDRVAGVAGDGVVTCAVLGFDRLMRDLLAGMLQLRRGLRVVVAADGVDRAVAWFAAPGPQVVIVDALGLNPSGLVALKMALATRPDVRIAVIAPAECPRPPDWIGDRACVVVGRDESFEILLERLESLFADATPNREPHAAHVMRHRPLTDREAEVATLMGEGLTTKEIARALGRSVHTIHTHRKRIAAKLGRLGSALNLRVAGHQNGHVRRGEPQRG